MCHVVMCLYYVSCGDVSLLSVLLWLSNSRTVNDRSNISDGKGIVILGIRTLFARGFSAAFCSALIYDARTVSRTGGAAQCT